ncbi:hypothetical protein T439DRAFT_358890 [Meredithblackwellia eburnea MCA 4105]
MSSKLEQREQQQEQEQQEDNGDMGSVLTKLAIFTAAMVVLPIGSYFLSRDYYFGPKNTTPPGIIAATMANIVLVAFIWVALKEDREDAKREKLKKKQ